MGELESIDAGVTGVVLWEVSCWSFVSVVSPAVSPPLTRGEEEEEEVERT